MKKHIFKIILGILLLVTIQGYSQDKIIKKDGTVLEVVIKEMTEKQLKYVDYNDQEGIIFTVDKALVKEVVFSHGKKIEIKDPKLNKWYFADDKINNFMLNFSAFGGNTLALAYERALIPGQSIMGELKLYGIGVKSDVEVSKSGIAFDVYYRVKLKSLFSSDAYRPKHLLYGSYFAPNIGFSTGSYKYSDYYYIYDVASDVIYEVNHSIVNIGISYGKQWILQNTLSIDASVGFHYYFGSVDDGRQNNDYYVDNTLHLGNMWGSSNKLVSFNLRIGFLAGKARIVK